MAFFRTVRIIRERSIQSFKFDVNTNAGHDACEAMIRRASRMPKTVRVEVLETDTQLYGLPVEKRTYVQRVVNKIGVWLMFGPYSDIASLQR